MKTFNVKIVGLGDQIFNFVCSEPRAFKIGDICLHEVKGKYMVGLISNQEALEEINNGLYPSYLITSTNFNLNNIQ